MPNMQKKLAVKVGHQKTFSGLLTKLSQKVSRLQRLNVAEAKLRAILPKVAQQKRHQKLKFGVQGSKDQPQSTVPVPGGAKLQMYDPENK